MDSKKIKATDIESEVISLLAACTGDKARYRIRLLSVTNLFTETVSYRVEVLGIGYCKFLSIALAIHTYNNFISMTKEELHTFIKE